MNRYEIITLTGDSIIEDSLYKVSVKTGLTIQQLNRIVKNVYGKHLANILENLGIASIELLSNNIKNAQGYNKKSMAPEEALKFYREKYPNENWKYNPVYNLIVSDLGNVGSMFSYRGLCKNTINNNGYLKVNKVTVHKLVWTTFNGDIPEGYEIMHIDSDKTNNKLSNLKIGSHSENLVQRNKENENQWTPIMEYDTEGNFIKEWKGLLEYAEAKNVRWTNAYLACTGRCKTCRGSIILYKGHSKERLQEYVDAIKNKSYLRVVKKGNRKDKSSRKSIIKLDLKGNELKVYDSVTEAAIELKTQPNTIISCIKGRAGSVKGFKFKYKGE